MRRQKEYWIISIGRLIGGLFFIHHIQFVFLKNPTWENFGSVLNSILKNKRSRSNR